MGCKRGYTACTAQPQIEAAAVTILILLIYVLTGVITTFIVSIGPQTSVLDITIPDSASCLRASRYANYVHLRVPLGTPSRIRKFLLKFELAADEEPVLRSFAYESSESHTLACDTAGFGVDASCTDVAVLSGQPGATLRRRLVNFRLGHYTEASYDYMGASAVGADGSLYLRSDTRYWLTSTHLCAAPLHDGMEEPWHAPIDATWANDTLHVSTSALAEHDELKAAPAVAQSTTCAGVGQEDAVLFPEEAQNEQGWLSLDSSEQFKHESSQLEERRVLVELGLDCAANASDALDLEEALNKYVVACENAFAGYPYGTGCKTAPSVPFRRLSTSVMLFDVRSSGLRLWAEDAVQLHPAIARGAEYEEERTQDAAIRVLLIMLAAGVVYVRAHRSTASTSFILTHARKCCVEASTCDCNADKWTTAVEDAIVGFVAAAARIAVATWRVRAFEADGLSRLWILEVIAASLSLAHLVVRNLCLRCEVELPITKLGGPTAVVDAVAAVMIAFVSSPLFAASDGRFEPTARLLVASLIVVVALPRCAIAASACALRWMYEPCRNSGHANCLVFGGVVWAIQCVSIAILISDGFAASAAFEMGRVLTDVHPSVVRATCFFAMTCVGLPRLTLTARNIAKGDCNTKD